MQDDIVMRLRGFADVKSFPQGGKFLAFEDLLEAADEIERLREELRKYTGDGHVAIQPFTPEAL